MPNTTEGSEVKRGVSEKYLQGNHPHTSIAAKAIPCLSVIGNPAPLSFQQQQLWYLIQFVPDIPLCTECLTIQLPEPLDVAALEQSLNEIIKRHESLRTSLSMVDGRPVQIIHPFSPLPLSVMDLWPIPAASREIEAHRLAEEEAQKPFDLARCPLLRATLMLLADADHRLLLTMHHIFCDAFSIYQVLLPELLILYEAFSGGKPSPLSPLPIQYADFAAWQREWVQGKPLVEQLAYWKKQLAGAPASLELPTGRPHPQAPNYRGSRQSFALSGQLTDALRDLSRQEGVSLFMTLLAAFQTLLHRYTGQDDLLIGTLTEGRERPELRGLIGYFNNTLVLRTDLSGDPTFRELLGRVRQVTCEAYAHQDVPFEYLVKELRPERRFGQHPFFQVRMILEPTKPVLSPGWSLAKKDVKISEFDLSLELSDQAEGMHGHLDYRTDLFDEETINQLIGHWQTLLAGIVDNPRQHLSELPLLTEAERQQLLVEWNATTRDYPKDRCIHQLVEAQVERTPDAVALVCEGQQMTYRELNARANQLAHRLQQLGAGPEVRVGLCMERSLEMMVSLLGILKAGAAYVPLDPAYPKERLAFMLSDSQIPLLLTQQPQMDGLPEHDARGICLDTEWKSIAQESEANPTSEVKSENLAYILYTSGSTGKPKGVMVEHRQLLNYTHSIIELLDLTPGLSFAMVQPLTVDSCITVIFPSLCTGGCLHLISREQVIDAHAMEDYFHRHQIDCLKIAPSHLAALQAASRTKQLMPRRRLIIGGEASPWDWVARLPAIAPSCTVFNHYGPTEATVGVLTYRVEKDPDERSYAKTPLGRPIANTQIYLLDQHLHPVPIGVPGELYIGGANVARGYLNRPELTTQKFIADLFSTIPGALLYKTGDLARYLPDGNIEFLGRIDNQVKIRGFRIELGEVDAVLGRHPGVRSVLVTAREDIPGEKRLVAYVALQEGQSATVGALQRHAMQYLPTHMVPSAFVLLEALPMTPHGKVDLRALPKPDMVRITEVGTFVAPTSMLEHQLVQIWEELLNIRPIGIRDNFFDLGGHSLLATRLISRIEQVFRKKISLATLFAGPTIEHLANALQQEEEAPGPWSLLAPVQTGGSSRPFFFLHGDHFNGAFYCFPLARNLGPDQPFYALEPYRFDVLGVPPTLEAMTAAYLESLRSIQSEGPYQLGGFCNGGLVAYEMARQLHAQGEVVDLLVLIDPSLVGRRRLLRRAVKRFGKLMRLDQDKQLYCFLWLRHMYRYLQHVYRYLRFPRYRRSKTELDGLRADQNGMIILTLKELHDIWLNQGAERSGNDEQIEPGRTGIGVGFILPRLNDLFPEALFPPVEALRHDSGGIFIWVAAEYEPGFYPGKSTFFFTWDAQEHGRDVEEWRKVAEAKDKEVEVYFIAGTHTTCKTKYLHDLTEHLHVRLSKAQMAKGSDI